MGGRIQLLFNQLLCVWLSYGKICAHIASKFLINSSTLMTSFNNLWKKKTIITNRHDHGLKHTKH